MKVVCQFFNSGEENELFGGLSSTLSAWKASVKTRFNTYFMDKNLIVVTYLDPCFKTTFHNEEYENQKTKDILLQCLCEDICSISGDNKSDITSQVTDSSDLSDDDKSITENTLNFSFESWFSKIKKEKKTEKGEPKAKCNKDLLESKFEERETLKKEMVKYESLKMINNNQSPLQWWLINKDRFPYMALLVKKYLCAPCSSVESKRVFSVGGTIYSPKRNRMQAGTGEMLMFLHYNLRFVTLNTNN